MSQERVIVFKDKKSREISTTISVRGHGASTSVKDFISMLADAYGSPATTLTKAAFIKKLQAASDSVIFNMKASTREIAGVNINEKIKE